MTGTATPPRPKADTHCPICGAPAETGQLICLECGSRIALGYRKPPSWKVPLFLVTLLVFGAAAGIYFGVDALQDDANQEVASQSAPSEPQQAATDDENGNGSASEGGEESGSKDTDTEKPAEKKPAKKETPAEKKPATAPVGAGGVRTWPDGEDAYTVVILSSEDKGSATAFAQNARKAGTETGVLHADDFPSLSASTGFYIVFVGTYPSLPKAEQAAGRLGQRFSGAYPQFVNGSKSKG